MKCEDYRSALTEAALGAPTAAALEAHLVGCARCRASLEEQRRLLGRIDRELQTSLDVAPSAEFLARVRESVAEQGKSPQPWFRAWLVPAATVAVLVVSAYFVRREAIVPPPPKQVTADQPRLGPAPIVEPRREPGPPSPPGNPPTAGRVTPAPTRRTEPEVLIPPGQEALLQRFVEGLRSRRLESTSLLAVRVEQVEPVDISVPDLEVKPLVTEIETKEQS